jgi:hypothetical protein
MKPNPDAFAHPVLVAWGSRSKFLIHKKIGAGEEIRTLDPNLGKVVLYH